MLTLTTSSQATEVMLNFYSRIFCISKFPKEVPLESKEFQSYKAKKKKKNDVGTPVQICPFP